MATGVPYAAASGNYNIRFPNAAGRSAPAFLPPGVRLGRSISIGRIGEEPVVVLLGVASAATRQRRLTLYIARTALVLLVREKNTPARFERRNYHTI